MPKHTVWKFMAHNYYPHTYSLLTDLDHQQSDITADYPDNKTDHIIIYTHTGPTYFCASF